MTRVIATAWSRDGSRCYMRAVEFRGMEREPAEFIYIGHQERGSVRFTDVMPLRPPCDCGMCNLMEDFDEDELGEDHIDREDFE